MEQLPPAKRARLENIVNDRDINAAANLSDDELKLVVVQLAAKDPASAAELMTAMVKMQAAKHDAEMAAKDAVIIAKDAEIDAKDAVIVAKDTEMAGKDEIIGEQKEIIADLQIKRLCCQGTTAYRTQY
jgi:uncharacterized protein (DUF3084 family)